MAFVLAIDPDQAHSRTLARLTRELAGHELVVASSCEEAIANIDLRVPDLVIFPMFLSPAEESALSSRLQRFSGNDEPQTLAIPLLASENLEPSDRLETKARWFYWFRPHNGAAASLDPRTFAADVRTYVQRERSARPAPSNGHSDAGALAPQIQEPAAAVVSVAALTGIAAPPRELLSPATDQAVETAPRANAPAMFKFATGPDAYALSDQGDAESPRPPKKSAAERLLPLRRALEAAAGGLKRGLTAAAAGFTEAARAAARVRPPSFERPRWLHFSEYPRWLRYSTPAVVLVAGVTFTVGLPTRGWWGGPKPASGVAQLESVPDGSEVLIDGKRIGLTPLTTRLPSGSHEVEFRYRGATRTVSLDIAANENTELKLDWKRPPTASLHVTSEPSGASVTVDGKKRGVTPLTLDDLAAGQHLLFFEHAAGSLRRTVKLKPYETATLSVSVYSGWLTLFAPIELQISEDGQRLTLDDRNRVMLTSGHHELQLFNRELGFRGTQVVDVQPGEMTVVSVVLPKTTVTVTSSPGAEVWIDSVKAGETPLVNFPVELGTREIVLRNPTLGERRLAVTATVKPVQVNVDFAKPEA